MRPLGTLSTGTNSTSPCVALVAFDAAGSIAPSFALIQDSDAEIPFLRYNGAIIDVVPLLADFKYQGTRPQAAGGLRRNVIDVKIASSSANGLPYINAAMTAKLYQCGQRPDTLVFGAFVFDRSNQGIDLTAAMCLGFYTIDSTMAWDEVAGTTSFTLLDVLSSDVTTVGATDETIPDFFFYFNPSFGGTIIPKVFGQVPRIRLLNAFPTLSLKRLANAVSGIIFTAYNGATTDIILEENVDRSSALRQMVDVGGTVRIKMHDGETIAGTLSYDAGTNTITLHVVTRNTYYTKTTGHTEAKGSQATDTWIGGTYSSIDFWPTQTYLQNGADTILDPQGYMQADIHFYDTGVTGHDRLETNVNVHLKGIASASSGASGQNKAGSAITSNVVIHDLWADPTGTPPTNNTFTSLSAFYNLVSNGSNANGTVNLYGDPSFEFMKFTPTLREVRLFFNNPATGGLAARLTNNTATSAGNVTMVTTGVGNVIVAAGMAGGSGTVHASGTISFRNGLTPNDGDTVSVGDGATTKVFEFKIAGPATGSNVLVIIGATAATAMANLIAAINASGLGVAAVNGGSTGIIGDPWQMVGIEPASTDWSGYVRNGYSHFDPYHVYVPGEGRLIAVPISMIASVSDSVTAYGLTNMAKITLTAAPVDLGIGATSNDIYTDALFPVGADVVSWSQTVLNKILAESPLLPQLAGLSLTAPTIPWAPYMGWYCTQGTKVADIVDRWVFQMGGSMTWRAGRFEVQQVAWNHGAAEIVTVDGDDYLRPLCGTTDSSEMLENCASLKWGKVITNVDGAGKEFIPLYVKWTYGGWQDPFYKPAESLINKAQQVRDLISTYHFDLINDAASFAYAAGMALSIGHPFGLSCCERRISTKTNMLGLRWDALDPIVFKEFPLISDASSDALIDSDNMPLYPVAPDGKGFLMGAVGVVDETSFDLSSAEPTVSLTAKVSQFFTNARGLSITAPPFPPSGPSSPSTDPNSSPNGGGGGNTGHGSGGAFGSGDLGSPMPWHIGSPAAVLIDDLVDHTQSITVTVDADSFFSQGFEYTAAIVEPVVAAGVVLSGDVTGKFPDHVTDPYTTSYTLTITVNYHWFADKPINLFAQAATIRFSRSIEMSPGSGIYYTDIKDVLVPIARKEVTNIEGS